MFLSVYAHPTLVHYARSLKLQIDPVLPDSGQGALMSVEDAQMLGLLLRPTRIHFPKCMKI